MGIVRFRTESGSTRCGYIVGSSIVGIDDQLPHQAPSTLSTAEDISRRTYNRSEVTLINPVDPGTIVCLDGCYEHDGVEQRDPHVGELATQETPSLWVALVDSMVAEGTDVTLPGLTDDVRPGVELGLVIGERTRNCSPDRAREHIAGYITCRTFNAHDTHPGLYGYRMFEGFLGVGEKFVPDITLPVALGVRRNKKVADRSSTADLRFSLGELVSYASHVFTLDPGDLVLTGNPTRIDSPLKPGENVTAWIESVGRQTATVVAEGEGQ